MPSSALDSVPIFNKNDFLVRKPLSPLNQVRKNENLDGKERSSPLPQKYAFSF